MALKLKQTIPLLQVNEDSELTPIDLNTYIDNPDNVQLRFNATLTDGQSLPDNITVNEEGVLSGDAEAKTAKESPYNVTVIAQCEGVEPLFFDIQLKINSSLNPDEEKEEGVNLENKKNEFADYWEKFAKKLELPDLDALLSRKVSASEVYYLLGRFATLVIWNSDDLTPANEGKLIEIEGSSDHYSVYDFDIALVASPKELYNGDRCLNDSLLTAKCCCSRS